MKEITLYKFVNENDIEYHYVDSEDDIILFVPYYLIEDFAETIGTSIMDEEGLECVLKSGYIAIMMQSICDYHNVQMFEIFDKTK